jgi:hypothetical protein
MCNIRIGMLLFFFNAKFFVKFAHPVSIKENQCYEDIHRTLLCEPETEFVSSDFYSVKGMDQNNSKPERDHKPND